MRLYLALFAVLTLTGVASAATLYDRSVTGETPADQNMYYLAVDPVFGPIAATTGYAGGFATLETSGDVTESAGFYNYDSVLGQSQKTAVSLDRGGDGFTLRFEARVDSESHANDDRAGFSVIALASDGWGIELGFWTDSVWAQNDGTQLFTQGESAAFDTTAAVATWDLAVAGTSYTLYAGDALVLSGNLRKYEDDVDPAAEGNLFNGRHVYFLDDFIFLGDNTSSAGGAVTLGNIETLDAAVPEPAAASLLSIGAVGLLIRRRKRHR
jgi:hypothetical protein